MYGMVYALMLRASLEERLFCRSIRVAVCASMNVVSYTHEHAWARTGKDGQGRTRTGQPIARAQSHI